MASTDKDDVQVLPDTHLPLSHLIVGGSSPTALHGRTISFIQGVVTVPLKVRILAGAKIRAKNLLLAQTGNSLDSVHRAQQHLWPEALL